MGAGNPDKQQIVVAWLLCSGLLIGRHLLMLRRTATGYVAAFPAMERLAVGCNIYVQGRTFYLPNLLELSQSQKILFSKI